MELANNEFINRKERRVVAKNAKIKPSFSSLCNLSEKPLRTLRLIALYAFFITTLNNFPAFSQNAVKTINSNKFESYFIKPDKIKEPGPNHYFFDFGKDAFGTLVINFKPTSSDTIRVLK